MSSQQWHIITQIVNTDFLKIDISKGVILIENRVSILHVTRSVNFHRPTHI